MKVVHHAAFSLTLSGLLYYATRSWGLAVGSLVSGVLIDLDHVMDYLMEFGPRRIDWAHFFDFFYNNKFRRLYLVLHAWEWVALLALASWLSGFNPWATGLMIGFFQHILTDKFTNRVDFLGYSLLYRWKKGFDARLIVPHKVYF